MPIIQENPTYFSDKPIDAVASSFNRSTSQQAMQQRPRCGISSFGVTRKQSVTSYDDTEDGSEMEAILSSCESYNSCNSPDARIIPSSSRGLARNNSQNSYTSSTNNNNGYTKGSLKRNTNKNHSNTFSQKEPSSSQLKSSSSGVSSLTRLGQLFKKSKSKLSVGSESHASTIDSSGIGSPTFTPDSSLSIYTNSLDGDSQSSSNSNQISPQHLEESMEDKFCSTYAFDDCGIFAANMYYNVGESSVFTIYHQHNNRHTNGSNNGNGGRPIASSSRGSTLGKGATQSAGVPSDRDDEFEDCVQPYYNTTFSTFPNPKRCSVASAASTTTSSVVPVPIPLMANENEPGSLSSITGKLTSATAQPIQHDRDGYLRPNEARNLRNVKNLYINDSVIANANRNGQVQQVQVDVHTPTSCLLNSADGNKIGSSSVPFSEANNSGGSGSFNSSAASSSGVNSGARYHFDSAGSTTSAATTLVAGGSNNFLCELQEDENIDESNKSSKTNRNGPLPVYMNRAYFHSNSVIPANSPVSSVASPNHSQQQSLRIFPTSVAADCEPYCSLCASSIMGSPRQRSKMDVVIVKCKECFFSREAESHIRGFFDKLMTEEKQKMDVTLKSYDLKDLDHPTDRVVVHSAKVQIVIISHHFLQRLKDEASRRPRLSPINRVFRSKNVIAVLLAVSAQDVLESYESVLPRFREWFSVDLRSTNKYDPEFCKKFTEQVVRIYNVELSNSSNFSVFPKKVTREQPKIAIVFKKPIDLNDEVRVELSTQKHTNTICENVKLENPHTTLLRIPESLSPGRDAIVDVSVFVNNNKIGGSRIKSELNMRRTDDDDIDRMAKQLPPFLNWLDKHIAETLLKHYKECTDYTADPELELMNGIIICRADILPTIMHFAAFYGLRQTALTVLEEADGLPHCSVKNEINETPSDIAFARGYDKLGQDITKYLEIANFCTPAYRFFEELVGNEDEQKSISEDVRGNRDDDVLESKEKHDENKNVNLIESREDNVFNFDAGHDQDQGAYDYISDNEDLKSNMLHSGSAEACAKSDTPITSGHSSSDVGSATKSEDEEPKAPTPSTRRAKTAQTPHRRQYINVDGKPDDNPEVVQQRERKIAKSPELAQRRLSIIQNYDIPRTRDQDYEVPPPDVRPVRPPPNENGNETNIPVFMTKNTGPIVTDSGYLIMNEGFDTTAKSSKANNNDFQANPVSTGLKPDKHVRKLSPQSNGASSSSSSRDATPTPRPSNTDFREMINSRENRSNHTFALDAADEQLIELMNDFKNKTYDMKQVELLFENWKQRPDVQNSIKEKMKMLEKLREEYRQITQQKNKISKKPSVLDMVRKTLNTKRKKSNVQLPSDSSQQRELLDGNGRISTMGLASPTELSFTGPNLPPQPFVGPTPTSPSSHSQYGADRSRVSESSYRTSIDSRMSDSSADSAISSKHSPPLPAEYNNPLSKRFVSSYVLPNPASHPIIESEQNGASPSPTLDTSYQVPPPPRPVRPLNKGSIDDQKTSPNFARKPPAIPEEQESSNLPKTPPEIPPKPTPKYADTEASSPPPMPPPRTNNNVNLFSYIDYKKKTLEDNETLSSAGKKSYENMNSE